MSLNRPGIVFLLLIGLAALVSFREVRPHLEDERSVEFLLVTGPKGEELEGSVDAVRLAALNGERLRVGWQLSFKTAPDAEPVTLEHWSDAGFITIWHGHVFAQIRDIYTQGPVMDRPEIMLGREAHGWVAMLGTDGSMKSVFSGEAPTTDRVVTRWSIAP